MKTRDKVLLGIVIIIGIFGFVGIAYGQTIYDRYVNDDINTNKSYGRPNMMSARRDVTNYSSRAYDDNYCNSYTSGPMMMSYLSDNYSRNGYDDHFNENDYRELMMSSDYSFEMHNGGMMGEGGYGRGMMDRDSKHQRGGMYGQHGRYYEDDDSIDDYNYNSQMQFELLVFNQANNKVGYKVNNNDDYDITTNGNKLVLVIVNDNDSDDMEISFDKNVSNRIVAIDGIPVNGTDIDNGYDVSPRQEIVLEIFLNDVDNVDLLVNGKKIVEIEKDN